VISAALQRLRRGEVLERPEMRGVIHAVMQDESADSEVAELLRLLHARGETLDEVVGAAEAMRDLAVQLPDAPADAVDTCGTGGDGSNTFNISTVAMSR